MKNFHSGYFDFAGAFDKTVKAQQSKILELLTAQKMLPC